MTHLVDLADQLSDSDPQRSLALSAEALGLAGANDSGSYRQARAGALLTIATAHLRLGDSSEALRAVLQAETLLEGLAAPRSDERAQLIHGFLALACADYPEALTRMIRALDLARARGDQVAESRALSNLSIVYHATGDYQRDLAMSVAALDLASAVDEPWRVAICANNIAAALLALGRHDEALGYARQALETAEAQGLDLLAIGSLITIGEIGAAMGEAAAVIDGLTRAIAMARARAVKPSLCAGLITLGQLYLRSGAPAQAIDSLQEALLIAGALDARDDMARCHRALADAYRRQADFAAALDHFERFYQIERVRLDLEAMARAQAITLRHEHEAARREAAHAEAIRHQLAERERSAEHLARLNQRLLFHVQQTPLGYIEWDLNAHVVTWNQAAEQIFGYSAAEVYGRRIRDLIVPERLWPAIDALRSELTNNTGGRRMVNANRTSDGREIICEWHNTSLRDSNGAVIGWAGLVQDITEQIQNREALQRVNAELQQRNAELDAYARTVAHDLKNLLASLVGASAFLEIGYEMLQPAEIARYLKIISYTGNRAARVIDDLLLLARPDDGQVVIRPVEMGVILHEVLDQLALPISQHQATITLPDSWPTALGYAPWVESVWINYISNALKYGGRPPQITLGATPVGGAMVRFWVGDNGASLTEEQLGRLFVEFQRLDTVRAPGHGIGLAIVQRVVARLGGQVGAEGAPGGGCVFWFTLPAAPACSEDVPYVPSG